jgi:phosphohistidine phosphatase
MKTLIIVRHAKAESLPPNKTDFERKLTDSGKSDALKMAAKLESQIKCPDIFIASPAKRAWSTAKRFAKIFNKTEEDIVEDKKIYEAIADTLIELVQHIDDDNNSAIIFGHNPGFSQLAYFFTGNANLELPTCGVAVIEFDLKHWIDIDYKKGKLLHFNCP